MTSSNPFSVEVEPFIGFAVAPIGDDRDNVFGRLGRPDATFRRTPQSPETDDYVALGAQVTYDDSGRPVFVEVFSPSDPTLSGERMLGRTLTELEAALRSLTSV